MEISTYTNKFVDLYEKYKYGRLCNRLLTKELHHMLKVKGAEGGYYIYFRHLYIV